MGVIGGPPLGTIAGALVGLDIPDWLRTSTYPRPPLLLVSPALKLIGAAGGAPADPAVGAAAGAAVGAAVKAGSMGGGAAGP